MAEMKGIKVCGDCANYDWKKHRCKIGCNDDSNAQAPFYGDCPLPDVVLKNEGRWEPDYETFVDDSGRETQPVITGWTCSLCGAFEYGERPYCPECGAKMKRGE